jgi:hypothetical protein
MFFVSSFLLPALSVLAMGRGIGWCRERGGAGMMQGVSRSCAREGEKRAAVAMNLHLESTLMHAYPVYAPYMPICASYIPVCALYSPS